MLKKWFVIVNPTSGNGAAKKKWQAIYNYLKKENFHFDFAFTNYHNHATKLTQEAIKNGYTNFITVGGDGTFHQLINGVCASQSESKSPITLGIIPVGTGNDWVKTYAIPLNYKKAIDIIKTCKTTRQDIGKLTLENNSKVFYFNNLAGTGLDAQVVKNISSYKQFGFLSYLIAGIVSIISFKKPLLNIQLDTINIKSKSLMLLIGICNYSGGGMQLTKDVNPTDGLFDITYIERFGFFNILGGISKIFNGSICNHKLVKTYKSSKIKVNTDNDQLSYIQADGEFIGTGNFSISLKKNQLLFIIP